MRRAGHLHEALHPRVGAGDDPAVRHAINLEEPDLFNRLVLDFLTAVESGSWARRDAGLASGSLT